MKITPLQQYIILGILGFLVLVFLFYQFALKPINLEISTLEIKRDQERKDLEDAKKIVAKYAEFKKRADSVQRELEWIQNRIPKIVDQAKLLEAVSLAQERSEVVLTSFQFSNSSAAANASYIEVPANVTFMTSYRGLLDFLYQVSLSNLLMTVRDLTITQSNDTNHLDVSLQATMVVNGIQAKQ